MPLEWSPESERMKELRRWEKPYRFQMYPRMLYRTQFNPTSGKHEAVMQRDVLSADRLTVLLSAEAFNASCQLIVNNEQEYTTARAEGWRESPKDAETFYQALQDEIAKAAAYRAYEDRNMSAKAKAEVRVVEDATEDQVPEMPAARAAKVRAAKVARLAKAREALAAKRAVAAG